MQIAQYIRPQSLEEAWELNQKKSAVILGGCCWLRLSPRRRIQQAIDISGLGLHTIEETDDGFRIGAMVSLRQLERCTPLQTYTNGAVKEALRHIVGVQFRNLATVGGSVCGRFGFSDVWTILMALDARVELYKGGSMTLGEFAAAGPGNDIVTHIVIPRCPRHTAYASLRLNTTDFPVIACAVSATENQVYVSIGARPQRAELQILPKADIGHEGLAATAQRLADGVTYGTNMRGSAAYRHDMAVVLCRRLLMQIGKEEEA
ncbi:MAG: FAD binding domain-containing protein [Megasphaera sp.]|jgi:CO/xanthine dehydrogenase FAD-binding subunit|nr:FAD binding domain-containing protein [Megasphaera sp.]MCI1247596.1 FAD binding domain-containing protein [Megasphaera sp.]